MEFVTVAEASSFQELAQAMPNKGLSKGTPFRIVMELNLPVAWAFDLALAELLFYPVTPPGLELKDVHSDGPSTVVCEYEADPAWLIAVGAFIGKNFVAITLTTIGIGFALDMIISSVKGQVPAGTKFLEPLSEIVKWLAIAAVGVVGVGTVAYLVTRPKLPTR